jgi:2-hydroxychromene-2-carboxylate isomerase
MAMLTVRETRMTKLEFWFDYASTYSYLSAMRFAEACANRRLEPVFRPFLLGPIFGAQGWTTSPFNLYPAKGANMWRDMARLCAARGLKLVRPEPFPQNSLLAARVTLAVEPARRGDLARAIYAAEFGEGAAISDPAALSPILRRLGFDAEAALAKAGSAEVKAALKAATDEAIAKGVYGAPSFITPSGELFWGDDRLDMAVDWAATRG